MCYLQKKMVFIQSLQKYEHILYAFDNKLLVPIHLVLNYNRSICIYFLHFPENCVDFINKKYTVVLNK